MKTKTIDKAIGAKVDAWLNSLPESTGKKAHVRSKVVVTGGCIASMLLKEPVNDYDIYLSSYHEAYDLALYYAREWNESGKGQLVDVRLEENRVKFRIQSTGETGESPGPVDDEIMDEGVVPGELDSEDKPPFVPVHFSQNAVTLTGGIQLIVRFTGCPEEIHKNFDFVHCTNYWTEEKGVVLNPQALEALLTRELRYIGSLYPVCSIIRMRKFIKRGWSINAGTIFKILYQISKLDLDNIKVLEDQLTGVDALFFTILIKQLRKDYPDGRIYGSYITELIDRIF